MNKKYKIILFQKYLRKPVLNFGLFLNNFEFIILNKVKSDASSYRKIPTYRAEINRKKTNYICWMRRTLRIPNIRIKFFRDDSCDLILSYGTLLLTNKPYCIYIENGLAIYDYDIVIAKNPISRIIFWFIIRNKKCKKLIFMSEAAKKSFLSTINHSDKTKRIILSKSEQCYPISKQSNNVISKKKGETIRLLFSGLFYMKGGAELVSAFERLKKKYDGLSLTVITPIQAMLESDIEHINKINGINLLDAQFSEEDMNKIYLEHDIFILPTFRDSSPMVLLEAISFGLPIICNDQYATSEFVINGHNGFIYRCHPLKDYDPKTYRMYGKYRNPKKFYADLFECKKNGKLEVVEQFIYDSIEQFILKEDLIEIFSKNSLAIYHSKFDMVKATNKIESIFFEALK